MIPPVGKSGPGMTSAKSATETSGSSMKAKQASKVSLRL